MTEEIFDYIVTGAGSAGCAVAARLVGEWSEVSRAFAGGRRTGHQSVDPYSARVPLALTSIRR